MSDLTFMDELPEAARGSAKTQERAAEIKANAPKWAQWPSQTPASAIKKALAKIDPDFEVVGRKCADGKVRAFVRFAPQEEPSVTNGNGAAKSGPPPRNFDHTSEGQVPGVRCIHQHQPRRGQHQGSRSARIDQSHLSCVQPTPLIVRSPK